MTGQDLKAWQQRHSLTYETAAALLGMGRATYARYAAAAAELPRWLALACAAVDHGLAV